jgi:DNA-binding NtrC family response regulator
MAEPSQINLSALVFAPFGKDAALIERVLRQSSVPTWTLATIEELASAISEDAGAAIITEEALQNGAIAALAGRLAAQPPWSDFPIIVLTGSGMTTASTESAVRSRAPLGNVTLLERPLRPITLISAVRSALIARRMRCAIICASGQRPRTRYAVLTTPWNPW